MEKIAMRMRNSRENCKTNHVLVCKRFRRGASGTQADNPRRLGLVVEVRQIGRSRNIAQATLEDSLDVLPRLQQVMDQYVTLRLVVEDRTNCQHSWSGTLGSSQHGTSEMR